MAKKSAKKPAVRAAQALAKMAAKIAATAKPPGKRGPKPKSVDQMTDEEVGVAMAFRAFGVDTDPDSSGDPLEEDTE